MFASPVTYPFGLIPERYRAQHDAGVGAAEGNVEMVRAGEAFLGHLRQHATDDAAQRVVDESVVVEAIVHGLSEITRNIVGPRTIRVNRGKQRISKSKGEGFCCPVPSRTALTSAV